MRLILSQSSQDSDDVPHSDTPSNPTLQKKKSLYMFKINHESQPPSTPSTDKSVGTSLGRDIRDEGRGLGNFGLGSERFSRKR